MKRTFANRVGLGLTGIFQELHEGALLELEKLRGLLQGFLLRRTVAVAVLASMVIDASQPSYSHTYFLAQDGNKSIADASELLLTDAAGAAYMPQAGSKLIGAASFGDALLNGVTPVNYVGTFGAGDTWMDGWTNFDPNNTDY